MTDQIIVIVGFLLIYFNISGLATTNILRLTAGNSLPILASKCCCDNCGAKITPFYQLPIISYILCRGRCRTCGGVIPVYPLVLELLTFSGMSLISSVLDFSFWGVSLSFLYYELLRVVMIFMRGPRKNRFVGQYLIAVGSMVPFYGLTLFVSLIYGGI